LLQLQIATIKIIKNINLCFIGSFFIWFILREMIQLLLSVNRLIYYEHNACPITGGLCFAKLALFKLVP